MLQQTLKGFAFNFFVDHDFVVYTIILHTGNVCNDSHEQNCFKFVDHRMSVGFMKYQMDTWFLDQQALGTWMATPRQCTQGRSIDQFVFFLAMIHRNLFKPTLSMSGHKVKRGDQNTIQNRGPPHEWRST